MRHLYPPSLQPGGMTLSSIVRFCLNPATLYRFVLTHHLIVQMMPFERMTL
jgi:hypothetical protein